MEILKCFKKLVTMAFATILLASCHSYLFDWEATPEDEVVQIPREGGIYGFAAFEVECVGTTRVIHPAEAYKCYRYRLNVGDNIGQSEHGRDFSITFEVPSNESGIERNVTLEISKAKEFHLSMDMHDKADSSEDNWEEWQTVWRGLQEK